MSAYRPNTEFRVRSASCQIQTFLIYGLLGQRCPRIANKSGIATIHIKGLVWDKGVMLCEGEDLITYDKTDFAVRAINVR
jgi:hypothetical protein